MLADSPAFSGFSVSDLEQARRFYTGTLGLRVSDVPGMGEFADLGLGELDVDTWNAIMAPAGTPASVVDRLADAIRSAAMGSDLADRLRPLGFRTVLSASPAALLELIRADTPRWGRLVQLSGARLD